MISAILVLLFLFQVGEPMFSGASGVPGVYLFQDGGWLPMLPAPAFKAKAKGFDNYIYTDGYTNLDINVSFAGPKAALRVSDHEPVFIVRLDDNNSEPMLVRLEKKRDRRVCRARPSSALIGNKHGFRKQDIVRTVITVNPDKSFNMRPERPLKPGEYLLVTGSPASGRDFGVD